MDLFNRSKIAFLVATTLGFSACGGSGGDSAPANAAPTANAGADQTVDEFAAVSLSGSGTDADGDTLSFTWTQTVGMSVTLANASTAQASFDAPDVLASATPVTLTFRLVVSDGTATTNDIIIVSANDIGLGANSPPMSSAGPDQTVGELTNITLDGSASSDPDGSPITYAWVQTSGPSVALSDATIAQPTFMSPDVTAGSPETLVFELTVDDGTDSVTDTVDIVVSEGLAAVTVAGVVSYEFVNPNANCGLNFNNIDVRPIRAATVQLLDVDNGNAMLDSMVAGDDGSYSFANVLANTNVRIRVRAELKRVGAPAWDVEVRDNVDTSVNPPPLNQRPLYVVQFPPFNTGIANVTNPPFVATTGWGGASYTSTRAAAPFAILDAIYSGMLLVLTADPVANFSPLDAFWSVNNTLTMGSPTDIEAGELSSSFYSSGIDSLFLLGDANVDTEEFDDHVSMHEWGHYFEDNFSRSDSIGGRHAIGQTLDPRVAFGEGWATALAAMALDNPQYCDSGPANASSGFPIDTEGENRGPQGYYNEMSVATLIYDLWDTDVDGSDNSSIGFGPIFDTMTGPQFSTEAFTTLFSFGTAIRTFVSGPDLAFVDAQLTQENITLAGLDIYGSNQTTQPGGARDVLPVYTDLLPNGTTLNICTNSDFDSDRGGNKLAEHRFLRLEITQQRQYQITVATESFVDSGGTSSPPTLPPSGFDCIAAALVDPNDPLVHTFSDPDFIVYREGVQVADGTSCTPNSETPAPVLLSVGSYTIDILDFRFADDDTVAGYTERVCLDVTATPN